jgi:molybdate transport system substrate-binding protein
MNTSDELHVTAAGAYEHALNELAPLFTNETGSSVRLTLANAAGVIKRLEASEPVDLVLTSFAGIEALAAAGLADAASKAEVGRMRLGMAVQPGMAPPDLRTADDLRAALRSAAQVAFIDPKGGGTSGPFLEKMFMRLGLLDDMRAKGMLAKTGREVVRAVASGQAAVGLTQASELIGAKGVEFAGYLPDDVQVVSVYAAAVASNARHPDLARRFLRFVTSPLGAERFRRLGWDVG